MTGATTVHYDIRRDNSTRDKYLTDNTDLNKRIFKRLIKYLSENTVQGKIMMSAQDLAVLEDIIYEQIKESDYEENISKYLELITALDNAISKEKPSATE